MIDETPYIGESKEKAQRRRVMQHSGYTIASLESLFWHKYKTLDLLDRSKRNRD